MHQQRTDGECDSWRFTHASFFPKGGKPKTQAPDARCIWRGGCIIRAALLEQVQEAYKKDAALANLMVDDFFAAELIRVPQAPVSTGNDVQ